MGLITRLASGYRAGQIQVRAQAPVDRRPLRPPQAANLQASWSAPGQPQMTGVDAQYAIQIGYYGHLYSFRCADKIARTIASLPVRAGRDPDKPDRYEPNAPLARLLGPPPGGPNPGTSSRQLIRWSLLHYMIAGRYAWETTPYTGQPKTVAGLWPLPSMWLAPIEAAEGSTSPWSSFRYQTPRGRKDLRLDQVHYAWRPSLEDWRKPESHLQALKLSLDLSRMMDIYMDKFMKNNMSATTLIVTPPFAEDGVRQAFQDQFVASMMGYENAGATYFTEVTPGREGRQQDVQVERIGVSARDAQFLELKNAIRDEICDGWGVPRSMLGNAAERTYENADQEERNYWRQTITDWIADFQDSLNLSLAPRIGDEVCWFDTSNVEALKPLPFYQKEPLSKLVGAVIDQNEAREELGLTPREEPEPEPAESATPTAAPPPNANVTQLGVTPTVSQSGDAALARSYNPEYGFREPVYETGTAQLLLPKITRRRHPVGNPAPHRFQPSPESKNTCAICGRHRTSKYHKRDASVPTAATRSTPNPRERHARMVDEHARRVESDLQAALVRVFEIQQAATLSRLEGSRGKKMVREAAESYEAAATAEQINPEAIFLTAYWREKTAEILAPVFDRVIHAVPIWVASQLGLYPDNSVAVHGARQMLHQRVHNIATEMTDQTLTELRETLSQGVEAGESIPQLADRVREVFTQATQVRAVRIARTEVIGAVNGAQQVYTETLPGAEGVRKEWLATDDDRTRPSHRHADGQTVNLGERFHVGGATLAYPGDPTGPADEVIQCRCTTVYIPPDVDWATLEQE